MTIPKDELPKSVRIGAIDFRVAEVNGLRVDGTLLNGHIQHDKALIEIEEELDPQIKWITLWHEVAHGILMVGGISDHTEGSVVALGYGIPQVLRDNPHLVNML